MRYPYPRQRRHHDGIPGTLISDSDLNPGSGLRDGKGGPLAGNPGGADRTVLRSGARTGAEPPPSGADGDPGWPPPFGPGAFCGAGLRIVRGRVPHFNAEGPEGLNDRKAADPPCKPSGGTTVGQGLHRMDCTKAC